MSNTAPLIALRVQIKQARAARNDAMLRHILAGGTPKEFAADNGVSTTYVGYLMRDAGLRKKFVTKTESEMIDKQRRSIPTLDGRTRRAGE